MKRKIFVLSLLLISVVSSIGQETKKGKGKKAKKENKEKNAVSVESKRAAFSPGGSGGITNMLSNFNLSSTYSEGANGRIELVHSGKDYFTWSGFVDQKIGKNSKEATPIDLNGVSPGTTVGFGIQRCFWNPNLFSDADAIAIVKVKRDYAEKKNKQLKNKKHDSCCCEKIEYIDTLTLTIQELFSDGDDDDKKAILQALSKVSKRNPWYISLTGSFTKTSFSYATDSVALAEIKQSFITPTINASLTKTFGNPFKLTGYLSFKYTYSQSYSAADDVNFTMPFGTTGNFFGKTLSFGKPEKSTTNNVAVEYRQNFYGAKDKNIFAIAPSVTLAIDRKLLNFQVPFYFIQGRDDKGKLLNNLQSGVRLGYVTTTEGSWTSFKDGFTAQLVISEPLSALMP